MNLGSIFKKDTRSVKADDVGRSAQAMSKGEQSYRVQSAIRHLTPGQTIQGSVVSRDGNAVQIALRGNVLINAKIDQSISLVLGQNMSFEVKSNNGSLLSLTPLYANLDNQATAMRALDAAGMPQTAANLEMVTAMMEEGMPIDRESLANIGRLMAEFPQQSPAVLVQMTRLGLPVTELTLEQFDAYRNAQHQLLGSAETIMDELPQVFAQLLAEGRTAQAFRFYETVLDLFTEGGADGAAAAGDASGMQSGDGVVTLREAAQEAGQTAETAQAGQTAQTETAQDGIPLAAQTVQNAVGAADAAVQTVLDPAHPETPEAEGAVPAQTEARGPLADNQWQTLADLMRDAGAEEQAVQQVRQGELPAGEALRLIRGLLAESGQDGAHHRAAERLLGSREFETLLKEEISRQWMIEPKDVADPRKVEQLYERIREQSMRLGEAVQAAGKGDTPVAQNVQNLQNNIDFMNQLNHMFTYIQLPLKLAGNHAHGDLYVYTNKKNLAARDGSVSALLHLDMEHLGPLDVYVTMLQNRVSTNFTVADESVLDLIEAHIHLLDERLAGRGYELKAQMSVKERQEDEETSVMQTILDQQRNISVLSRTSFDMRA